MMTEISVLTWMTASSDSSQFFKICLRIFHPDWEQILLQISVQTSESWQPGQGKVYLQNIQQGQYSWTESSLTIPAHHGIQALLSVFKGRVTDPAREKDTAVERCDVAIEDGEGKAKSRLIIKIVCRHGESNTPLNIHPPQV
jgi:hypothetical protein